jgi:hypothetical protein
MEIGVQQMILITGGCSFSEVVDLKTWPVHLTEQLDCESYHQGIGCVGNTMITKRVLLELSRHMSCKDELLVGIMWSGPDRSESYTRDTAIINKVQSVNTDGWQTNPITFPEGDLGGWIVHNVHWTNEFSENYYKYYDPIEGAVNTFQSILLMQAFLEQHNIKYFMSNYTSQTFARREHPSVSYLAGMIDYSKFLPVEGCFEWCRDNTERPFKTGDNHPSAEQHKQFTQQVIMPHLNKHNLI